MAGVGTGDTGARGGPKRTAGWLYVAGGDRRCRRHARGAGQIPGQKAGTGGTVSGAHSIGKLFHASRRCDVYTLADFYHKGICGLICHAAVLFDKIIVRLQKLRLA